MKTIINNCIIAALFTLLMVNAQSLSAQNIAADTMSLPVKIIEPSKINDTTEFSTKDITLNNFTNNAVVYRKPRPWFALGEALAVNAAVLGFDRIVQSRDYSEITLNVIKNNFKSGFVWDNDSFSGNQFSHPFHGSLFYNAARDKGLTYYQSLPYPIIGSAVWEFFCETNEPALNDLLSTGIGGAVIGEVTHRASDLIFNDRRTGVERVVREIAGSLVNPIRGLRRLVTGQSWRVSSYKGKEEEPIPYQILIATGRRYIGTHSWFKGQPVSFLEFKLNYGDRFNDDYNRPYDLFHTTLLLNINDEQPSIGNLDIWARLFDKKYYYKSNWKFSLGTYQMLKYLETYPIENDSEKKDFPIISEAVSFGGGFYAEYENNKIVAANNFIAGIVPLGGFRSDYFIAQRSYNFASGFSIRNDLSLKIANKVLVGDQFYFARFYVLNGYSPEEFDYRQQNSLLISKMGDKGNCSVFTNRIYLQVSLIKRLKIDLETAVHYRKANYKYYQSVKGRSYELKLGFAYGI